MLSRDHEVTIAHETSSVSDTEEESNVIELLKASIVLELLSKTHRVNTASQPANPPIHKAKRSLLCVKLLFSIFTTNPERRENRLLVLVMLQREQNNRPEAKIIFW